MLLRAVPPYWIGRCSVRGLVVAVMGRGTKIVVFEISPSHIKTFHYRPHRPQPPPPDPTRTRCATSLRWLCFRQVRRPSHLVQVQSPISTALSIYIILSLYNIRSPKIITNRYRFF